MLVPITAIYAALSGFLVLALAANVVRYRFGKNVSFGDDGHQDMTRVVRAHGNTVEYVPLALILMALLELNGGSSTALHLYGVLLIAGRAAYSYGLLIPKNAANPARQAGIVSSWLVILAAGIQLLLL